MTNIARKLVLGAILAASAATLGTTAVRADDYWNGHWRWYDNSYRPYYQRHYYSSPYYGGGYRTYYGPSPYYGNGYNYGPAAPTYYYGNGYTYPNYYPGPGVQVGPLRFGWW
jgi:hypothetical protein